MKYRQPVSMPSSVSAWLNEQLEARGIDSEVYSRYILSLLHANSLDILHPEEDDFLEHKKEGRRTVAPHRRFRRASIASTLWWRHARYDADQIKRSAAVKCLKSAADQNCEIESLVNELCEKLKEVDAPSESDTFQDLETSKKPSKISKKELAEKYYAAFPALCPEEENIDVNSGCQKSKFENSVWLSLQKRASQENDLKSPEKKVATKTPPKKAQANNNFKKRHPKVLKSNKNNMEAYRTNNKNNFQHHNGGYKSYTKEQKEQLKKLELEMMDNFNSWQFLNNFSLEERDQCLDPANTALPDEMDDIDMYDSLPVNLSNLLDDSNDNHVSIMNSANTQKSGKQHKFIPYGSSFVSSIWSNDDNSGPKSNVELALDYEFGPVSVDLKQKNSWPDFNSNEQSNFLDQNVFNNNNNNQSVFSVFHNLPMEDSEKDENVDAFLTEDNECLFDRSTISLMKINHNKETSGFVIVEPHSQPIPKPFNLFGTYPQPTILPKNAEGKSEDLMMSESTHFVPIKDTIRADSEGAYQDGASFLIGDILEKLPYKRSQSGSLCLEQEFGQIKKYQEYPHTHETDWGGPLLTDDFNNLNSTITGLLQGPAFVPKFCVEQNNVACQTDPPAPSAKTSKLSSLSKMTDTDKTAQETEHVTPEIECDQCNCAEEMECECGIDLKKDGGLKKERRDSITEEVAWPKDESKICDKCNNNDEIWTMDWLQVTHPTWKYMENAEVIWSGREVCQSCLRLNEASKTPQSDQHMKLKEDIFQDGEQLLSDINSLQKNFVEMSRPFELVALEPLTDKRKRRHSYIDNATNEKWGFQSRFHDDYGILRTWTVPSLRSVTL